MGAGIGGAGRVDAQATHRGNARPSGRATEPAQADKVLVNRDTHVDRREVHAERIVCIGAQ